ncbi:MULTISPECIES: cysteine desulfurase family protein [Prochlorococcus]|uniref:Cysteine sulfinate desulfinase/cysteine desulfurase n=1 Tax=Prochlorococcus marinus (strain SARG / CCMP1375 / SS120) TaxID=167539 RepID=Q7VBZ3_PROMA|nr:MULTISPECIES: cysteine desulfurase family protein [Prochlorococcus]AAP99993.1 Cysteine sulfinate desulfinase/cysteine desulfurase [Prochlorococcus marinus subsp. marinus str. CCMP1375]KGG13791.1 Cysteine desulfurase [Prochlorococcus marinus str. LG]KGG18926.1 Cysteine desulfurase [Prochlorococcus marinus str. SS2]KGG23536.1 Cysteine desulfurase [Prochlorococcus marinus str. SS35]KGG32228.1 Cysteine desulfurase [Prochlorococcus marinus str. SS51]
MDNNLEYIYLDGSATSPPLDDLANRMKIIQEGVWGNPSSLHYEGIKAAEIIESSKYDIAAKFNVLPDQIIITSGATESIQMIITSASRLYTPGRIVISSVEHPAVIFAADYLKNNGWDVLYWPVDKYGVIDITMIDELLAPPTKIVSIIWGQNEIGTVQPITQIATACKKKNLFFHTDATQVISQGCFNFNTLGISSFSASAHKFRGPKGVGLLIIDKEYLFMLKNLYDLGNHIPLFNKGTLSPALTYGMSLALNAITQNLIIDRNKVIFENTNTSNITKSLLDQLKNYDTLILTGHPLIRLPNHLSFVVKGKNGIPLSGRQLVRELSKKGICVSTGSACSSKHKKSSHVLKALNLPDNLLKSSLRISLGNWLKDIDPQSLGNIIISTIKEVSQH